MGKFIVRLIVDTDPTLLLVRSTSLANDRIDTRAMLNTRGGREGSVARPACDKTEKRTPLVDLVLLGGCEVGKESLTGDNVVETVAN